MQILFELALGSFQVILLFKTLPFLQSQKLLLFFHNWHRVIEEKYKFLKSEDFSSGMGVRNKKLVEHTAIHYV